MAFIQHYLVPVVEDDLPVGIAEVKVKRPVPVILVVDAVALFIDPRPVEVEPSGIISVFLFGR